MSQPLPDVAVVIPTYWTRPGGMEKPGDAVYDHPTPLDEDGTLGRLLESLTRLNPNQYYAVILVAVTDDRLSVAAEAKVRSITGSFPGLNTLVVGRPELDLLLGSASEAAGLVDVRGYSRVRNLQLAVPIALATDVVVALDDDEVVTDDRFLEVALRGLGAEVEGHVVDGSGGYYLQNSEGQILLDVPPTAASSANVFDRKAAVMNAGTEQLEAMPGRMVPTPFCFGGNMVFSRDLASTVCFDPYISRGEDIDYLINARLVGKWFFMNKDLRILHLPPHGGSYKDVAYHKVVQDVIRFVYEREKLRSWRDLGASAPVTAEDLSPYPGTFLSDDLDGDAEQILDRIIDECTPKQRELLGLAPTGSAFIDQVSREAKTKVRKFREYQTRWPELIRGLEAGTVGSRLRERVTVHSSN